MKDRLRGRIEEQQKVPPPPAGSMVFFFPMRTVVLLPGSMGTEAKTVSSLMLCSLYCDLKKIH